MNAVRKHIATFHVISSNLDGEEYDPARDGEPRRVLDESGHFIMECGEMLLHDKNDLSLKEKSDFVIKVWKTLSEKELAFFTQLKEYDFKRYEE